MNGSPEQATAATDWDHLGEWGVGRREGGENHWGHGLVGGLPTSPAASSASSFATCQIQCGSSLGGRRVLDPSSQGKKKGTKISISSLPSPFHIFEGFCSFAYLLKLYIYRERGVTDVRAEGDKSATYVEKDFSV